MIIMNREFTRGIHINENNRHNNNIDKSSKLEPKQWVISFWGLNKKKTKVVGQFPVVGVKLFYRNAI